MNIGDGGIGGRQGTRRTWLTATILAHLVVLMAHGLAHAGAGVHLSRAAAVFVGIVIVIGPLGGLMLMGWSGRLGGAIIGITMTGAFVFGMTDHFITAGPDHVGQVEPSWRLTFTITAILLALTEATGAGLGMRMAWTTERRS